MKANNGCDGELLVASRIQIFAWTTAGTPTPVGRRIQIRSVREMSARQGWMAAPRCRCLEAGVHSGVRLTIVGTHTYTVSSKEGLKDRRKSWSSGLPYAYDQVAKLTSDVC